MTTLKLQMLVVAIALIVAGTQCQAQCAVEGSNKSAPPCHRHQSQQEPCQHLALVSDHPAPAFAFSTDTVAFPTQQPMLPAFAFVDALAQEESPPTVTVIPPLRV